MYKSSYLLTYLPVSALQFSCLGVPARLDVSIRYFKQVNDDDDDDE